MYSLVCVANSFSVSYDGSFPDKRVLQENKSDHTHETSDCSNMVRSLLPYRFTILQTIASNQFELLNSQSFSNIGATVLKPRVGLPP